MKGLITGNVLATVSDRKIAHSSNSSTIDYYEADIVSAQDYYPFGMIMPGRTVINGNAYRYGFGAHEKDDEIKGSGNHLSFGGYGYDPRTGKRWNLDPLAADAPSWSPYRAFFCNPIRYTDPDGRWEWDATGNLLAQKNDNSYSLAKYLGTNQKNAMTILNRAGYRANDKGVLNIKVGNKIGKSDLWVGFKSSSRKVVNNTKQAMSHYFDGNGEAADVGDQSTRELLSSSKFNEKHTKITTRKVQEEGNFSVDLTNETFHIGRTNVDYKVSGNGKSSSVTYTLFARDGFWDVDFIDEKAGKEKPDGPGPNLERFGGTPYPYKTRERTYFFKPVEEQK